MGDDFNQWVCKYKDVNKLFNELLASEFAKLWDIKIPETALVYIDYDEYISSYSDKKGLERSFFERECFGSLFIEDTIEVNNSMLNDKGVVQKIKNKDDFLKIALFDIWLSNEDRNSGNYNLLLQGIDGGYTLLYVIDHTDIFNSSMAYYRDNTIVEITEEDTVLNSTFAKLLYNNNKIVNYTDILIKDFDYFANTCRDKLPSILNQVPESWNVDLQGYRTKIDFIFSDKWLEICKSTFREYTQKFVIQKTIK